MSQPTSRKRVVITVPLSRSSNLKPDEEISLRHLRHFLGAYDKVLVVPKSLDLPYFPDFQVKQFGDQYFGSVSAYNSLMLSREFYRAFGDYEFMLHYHLDALVFSDQLLQWCDAGWDYIAPPWVHCKEAEWVREPFVGNGGFSLRRIDAFLRVLKSRRLAVDPDKDWEHYILPRSKVRRLLGRPRRILRHYWPFNGVHTEIRSYLEQNQNEDLFWAHNAVKYYPNFKMAPVEEGMRFAFELVPGRLFEMNSRKLPFGCHAFGRYDRAFWEPYLLKEAKR
ncbi:MAG TPA: DUF5672 family protein [Opitutaceae bacterium]